jgi:UDP-3-O-[3-hydroxymyristoyl] glucosamine N-acyltransferase
MNEEAVITVAELASRLGGELCGDGSRMIRRVDTLAQAGPQSLSWLGDAKYAKNLLRTAAACVLTPCDLPAPEGRTVIRVDDPDLALAEALALLGPEAERVPDGVHPSAVVAPDANVIGAAIGPNATVGARTTIGAGAQLHAGVHVGSDVAIGRDCVLWPGVVIRERTQIGDRVTIHPNASIGADGFGYLLRGGRHRKIPQIGRVIIEDDVEIGANSAVDRARSGETRIRRGTKIDNLVQIGHNCDIGEDCIIVGHCGVSGSVTMEHHVVLAGRAGIVDHRRLGAGAQVAAASVVDADVPAGGIVRGDPAVPVFEYGRQKVAIRRLPKMINQLRELRKRIEQLESAAHD